MNFSKYTKMGFLMIQCDACFVFGLVVIVGASFSSPFKDESRNDCLLHKLFLVSGIFCISMWCNVTTIINKPSKMNVVTQHQFFDWHFYGKTNWKFGSIEVVKLSFKKCHWICRKKSLVCQLCIVERKSFSWAIWIKCQFLVWHHSHLMIWQNLQVARLANIRDGNCGMCCVPFVPNEDSQPCHFWFSMLFHVWFLLQSDAFMFWHLQKNQ